MTLMDMIGLVGAGFLAYIVIQWIVDRMDGK